MYQLILTSTLDTSCVRSLVGPWLGEKEIREGVMASDDKAYFQGLSKAVVFLSSQLDEKKIFKSKNLRT